MGQKPVRGALSLLSSSLFSINFYPLILTPFFPAKYAVQLKSIKLSGFKSFVDPTHFEMPGQLIGVVGPNGCGKSNIIDAVRWVLGESRASELRGESMQDVIFNGSG